MPFLVWGKMSEAIQPIAGRRVGWRGVESWAERWLPGFNGLTWFDRFRNPKANHLLDGGKTL